MLIHYYNPQPMKTIMKPALLPILALIFASCETEHLEDDMEEPVTALARIN